jgi:Fe-S-cluster containining protein
MKSQLPVFYDCGRCPAYCCTYPRIIVEPSDIRRLARRFGITESEAQRKFTKKGEEPGERVLRHRSDEIFQTACRFLDRKTRRCTVYEDRPSVCREFPGTRRCGYYDFLTFERRAQEDPDLVVTAWVADT